MHEDMDRDDVTLCPCDDVRVVDEKERWRMKMRTTWRIRADMRNKGYDMPDWV